MTALRLQNKVAVVTGGGFGFGKAIVEAFVANGAKCLVVDINDANGRKVAAAQPEGTAVFCHGDVRLESDWKVMVATCIDAFGKMDIVVNNAGIITKMQPSIEIEEDKFDALFATNVKSLYHSARTCVPIFQQQNSGVFINLSSISAPRPRPFLVWYAGTKGAVSSITKGLAAELAPFKIRVNAILPVAADTAMAPYLTLTEDTPASRQRITDNIALGRWAEPGDIASAAVYLACEEASFLTGVLLKVDGGRSLA